MTRNDLALAPTEGAVMEVPAEASDVEAPTPPPVVDGALILRLAEAIETLAALSKIQDPELKVLTPAEAGRALGKTENWVKEAIQDRRIPFTYVGKSPRLLPRHIRWVLESGELMPHSQAA
ncbi:hypothetical protein ACZ90_11840 [Streptomyces albus subsp. albus]|uniref:hypothetical protein n=1 Tax=Streptomycetaceae TaxID=2062 RepID=UPI0004BD56E9|nr:MULTISPECIES: hypothetical protein [Streptomycetaceae]KOG78760.1 hypothetical protein ADK33_25960 [Streptomyces griseus subsp. rhodochrous]KUJ69389.1 hypothetical protein ACZ90_11840 [Streptomyces albus subsp. albus]